MVKTGLIFRYHHTPYSVEQGISGGVTGITFQITGNSGSRQPIAAVQPRTDNSNPARPVIKRQYVSFERAGCFHKM